ATRTAIVATSAPRVPAAMGPVLVQYHQLADHVRGMQMTLDGEDPGLVHRERDVLRLVAVDDFLDVERGDLVAVLVGVTVDQLEGDGVAFLGRQRSRLPPAPALRAFGV